MDYLIKIGNYIVPNNKIRSGGYFCDDSGVWFETLALMNKEKYCKLLEKIKANCDKDGFADITAYNHKQGCYISGKALFVEPEPEVYGVYNDIAKYYPIRFAFEWREEERITGGMRMEEKIKDLISGILDDVDEVRNAEEVLEAKDRLPLEIMALNAVANAYDKTK